MCGQTRVMVLWRSADLFCSPSQNRCPRVTRPCQHGQICLSTRPNQITRFVKKTDSFFYKIYLVLIVQLQTSRHRKAQITSTQHCRPNTTQTVCMHTESRADKAGPRVDLGVKSPGSPPGANPISVKSYHYSPHRDGSSRTWTAMWPPPASH